MYEYRFRFSIHQTAFDAPVSGVLIILLHNHRKPSLELVTLFNVV